MKRPAATGFEPGKALADPIFGGEALEGQRFGHRRTAGARDQVAKDRFVRASTAIEAHPPAVLAGTLTDIHKADGDRIGTEGFAHDIGQLPRRLFIGFEATDQCFVRRSLGRSH